MTGTVDVGQKRPKERVEASLKKVEAAVLRKCPNAKIITVSPWRIHEIAMIDDAGDCWHLYDTGYNLLLAFYPQVYVALHQ
jgi:hypothetical protein